MLISAPGACFPGGSRYRSCGVSPVTLIPRSQAPSAPINWFAYSNRLKNHPKVIFHDQVASFFKFIDWRMERIPNM
jgi:hypothetical protein